MDGKLSADLLKVHNANIQNENTKGKSTIASSASNMSGPTTTKLSMKDRVMGVGGGGSQDRSDKHSESSSKISGVPGNRFARIRTKLRLHTLLGGALSKRSGSEKGGPTRVLENTYKLGPEDGTKFNQQKAEQIIHNVLNMYLKDRVYDEKKFPQLCKTLSDLIKERVKLSGLRRYKVVAYVMVFENKTQGVHYTSRSLWETNLDNFATVKYNGSDFIAIGTIFATYYEWNFKVIVNVTTLRSNEYYYWGKRFSSMDWNIFWSAASIAKVKRIGLCRDYTYLLHVYWCF